ncbi:MAG: response regulator transcription factor [Hyphomicrobiaceae bacterium]
MLVNDSQCPQAQGNRQQTNGAGRKRNDYPDPPPGLSCVDTLTAQQRRVFAMLSEGLSNKQIARRLDLHESTVKVHVSAILAKLGCPNRTVAALTALYHRLQPLLIEDAADVALRNSEYRNA